ncbi:MAG: winged helix-turn-helix transcriptional regulator [Candidatus Methanoperedens sp.]|nr:winged helix-turn-helix transcriptional regulator [Candidatus Methanoperedens sp.]
MKLSDGMVFAIFLLLAAMYNSSFHPVRSSEGTTYIVTSASDEMTANLTYTGPPTTNIDFWQLPLWVLFVQLQPMFEFSFLRQFATVLSYKWLHGNPLGNDIRLRIMEYIKNNPGARFINIVRDTSVNRGTALYHIGVLEYFGMISRFKSGSHTLYFQNNGMFSSREKIVSLVLQEPTQRRIIEFLSRNEGATRGEIAEALGLTGSTITWHTAILKKYDLVYAEKDGAKKIHYLNKETLPLLERLSDSNREKRHKI